MEVAKRRLCCGSSDGSFISTRGDVGVVVDHTVIPPTNVLMMPLDPAVCVLHAFCTWPTRSKTPTRSATPPTELPGTE